MPHQHVPITVGLLFLIIVASFFFLGASVNKITGMATLPGACPSRIETALNKQHYNVNDLLTFTITIWDNNGNPMPNQLFYINKSLNGVYKWTRTYETNSNGIRELRLTVTSESIGDDTYLTYVNVAGCPYIFFTDYFDVGTASTTTTTSTTIPRSTTTTTTIPSGGAPTTTTTTTTSTTTTRPPITTPAESFDDGLEGYVSIENYINWGCGGSVAGSCSAKYPGYCYEYTSATCPKTYEARCAAGWNLVQVFVSPGTTSRGDNILYSCYKAPTNFCGNRIIDSGETCDDGNTVNDSESCSSDCKRINYFDIVISPIISCDNRYYYNYVYYNDLSADQACKEQGFTKSARYSAFKGYSPVICKWNGANWEALYDTRYSQGYYIHDLWCE